MGKKVQFEDLAFEKRQLCDIQGRLFELALKAGLDCPMFVEFFMNSRAAAALDDSYDRLQWAGEEYILEELDVTMQSIISKKFIGRSNLFRIQLRVSLWRDPGFSFKHLNKIADVAEACRLRDLRDAKIRSFQQGSRFGQSVFQQIFSDGHMHHPLKVAAAFVAAHGYVFCQGVQGKLFLIVLVKISHQLKNNAGIPGGGGGPGLV